ncbi:glycosyltransferase family 8 protein [Streptomyces turgidiscabies]|uniref:glycosyltransferase family 8 protein n=1 Tax=Streptomyces turgidiscabies TaxID=85558 RepID=UPI0038F650F9
MYAIGLCVDERYMLPALATVSSLAEGLAPRARREVALRVLALDLTPAHAVTLAHFARRLGFGSFDIRWRVPSAASRMADDEYISVTTYLRFQFTAGFVQRPYLIYLDADVLVRGDLSAPLDALTSNQLGAVQDEFNPYVGGTGHALPGVEQRWPHLRDRPYFNAGVLWMPVTMLSSLRAGVETALVRGRQHILHNDQDALNLWLLSSRAVQPVDARFNRFELGRFGERGNWVRRVVDRPVKADPDAVLVHFVGPEKPWFPDCPATEDVTEYRTHLRTTVRHLNRMGELGIEAVGGGRR